MGMLNWSNHANEPPNGPRTETPSGCCRDRDVRDAINRTKHGVPLALAEILFAGPHAATTDDRFDYGEVRQIAFGQIAGRLLCACMSIERRSGG